MADSPLELYHKAYVAHYQEDDVGQATSCYQSIIERFPESDEAGYALIQLQKITAESIPAPSDRPTRKNAKPLLIVSFLLNAVALGAISLAFLTYIKAVPLNSTRMNPYHSSNAASGMDAEPNAMTSSSDDQSATLSESDSKEGTSQDYGNDEMSPGMEGPVIEGAGTSDSQN